MKIYIVGFATVYIIAVIISVIDYMENNNGINDKFMIECVFFTGSIAILWPVSLLPIISYWLINRYKEYKKRMD